MRVRIYLNDLKEVCPDDRRRVVQHQGQQDDLDGTGGSSLHQVPSLLFFTLSYPQSTGPDLISTLCPLDW
jgi:hypothetical protein